MDPFHPGGSPDVPTVPPQDTAAPDAGHRWYRGPKRLTRFWRRLSDGLEVQQLWDQFRSEARTSYELYRIDVDGEDLGKIRGVRGWMRVARAWFWAIAMKLSPARRVLLVLALVLGVFGQAHFAFRDTALDLNFRSLGFLLLFVVLVLELADRVTMKRDLQIAREIQRWLVPNEAPRVPGLDIDFTTRPANTVSGDYYDAFLLDDQANRLLIVVADVAGKSVPAALLMASFQACLHSCARDCDGPPSLAVRLNEFACTRSLDGQRFTTAFLAELDLTTRVLRYVNAGHNQPVVRRRDGSTERLAHGGLPFGIDPGHRYDSGTTSLENGDLLFVFSDGLAEAVDAGDHEFGDARVVEAIRGLRDTHAAAVIRMLMDDVDRFVGGTRQSDDITCLALHLE
jgi:sigma-B regulation protein RsbU (phosphoserine phosphatase)